MLHSYPGLAETGGFEEVASLKLDLPRNVCQIFNIPRNESLVCECVNNLQYESSSSLISTLLLL